MSDISLNMFISSYRSCWQAHGLTGALQLDIQKQSVVQRLRDIPYSAGNMCSCALADLAHANMAT